MRLALTALLLLLGCGETDPAPTSEPRPPEPTEPSPLDPEPAPREPAPIERPPSAELPAAPESGCAFGVPLRIWPSTGWAAIAANGAGFVVAGSAIDGDGEKVFAVRVAPDGTFATLAEAAIDPPLPANFRRAGPAIASADGRVAIALAFGDRSLRVAELDPNAARPSFAWRTVGQGASLRFAPALAAYDDGWIAAWTDERETPLRVRARRVASAELGGAGDLSSEEQVVVPDGGSASAPVFVEGADRATLVFLDAREAVSVTHRVDASRETLGAPAVARPINLAASPPQLAAVRIGEAEWIAYTAIGSMATTAVGLVRVGGNDAAVPLVRGTGYGLLHVSVASLADDRALFVADAPQASEPDAPRELHARLATASGPPGAAVVIRGPGGTASRGHVAHAGGGLVGASFVEDGGTFVALGRCAVQ
jgi:hypothetical protein